jgi:hypothetical protein
MKNVEYIQIPLITYYEIQEELRLSRRIDAIKAVRNSVANIARGEDKYYLKECKRIVDWIAANPGLVFTNSEFALIPADIVR